MKTSLIGYHIHSQKLLIIINSRVWYTYESDGLFQRPGYSTDKYNRANSTIDSFPTLCVTVLHTGNQIS